MVEDLCEWAVTPIEMERTKRITGVYLKVRHKTRGTDYSQIAYAKKVRSVLGYRLFLMREAGWTYAALEDFAGMTYLTLRSLIRRGYGALDLLQPENRIVDMERG